MRVTANGQALEVAEGATVAELLAHLGLGGRWVLVERNAATVPRSELETTVLADGDRVELVRAVAGG